MDPKTRQDIVNDVFAERAAAEKAEAEAKKQEEANAKTEGWKTIFEYLIKINAIDFSRALVSNKEDPVYLWFDNAAYLIEKYDSARFDKMIDTFCPTVEQVEDEATRIFVADRMRFIVKMAAMKVAPMEYAKGVYAFRKLSDEIGGVIGNSDLARNVVVETWKDAVYIRHRGGPVKNILDIFKKTWFEKMIADIKAEDPKYEAPKFRLGLIMGDTGDK